MVTPALEVVLAVWIVLLVLAVVVLTAYWRDETLAGVSRVLSALPPANRVAWQPTRDGGYIGVDLRGRVYQVGPRMGGWRWAVEELTIFGALDTSPACRSWSAWATRAKFDRFIREESR